MESMGRPKEYDLPDHMTWDRTAGRWVVRNPVTGKRKKFSDEAAAERAAKAVAEWVAAERTLVALEAGRPTVAGLVQKWKLDRLPLMPWDEGTRQNMLAKMNRISRELGGRTIVHTDSMFIEDWIEEFCTTADTFNKWRYAFVLLWRFAVSRKLAAANEGEKVEYRSTSKKLAANQKQRQQLDLQGFLDIHEHAPPWLQLAMDQSLVSLQARLEICNIRHTDYRDGYLFIIRDKVSGDSDMAFIRIAITPQLEELRRRSFALDSTVSPFLIHRAPARRRREWTEGKPHWTYVNPGYLTNAFAAARDQVKRYADLPEDERPSFHEIRGLGARLYRKQGMPEADIQALMTHAHKRTTEIYLERGRAALTDDDFVAVRAPMVIRELVTKG